MVYLFIPTVAHLDLVRQHLQSHIWSGIRGLNEIFDEKTKCDKYFLSVILFHSPNKLKACLIINTAH